MGGGADDRERLRVEAVRVVEVEGQRGSVGGRDRDQQVAELAGHALVERAVRGDDELAGVELCCVDGAGQVERHVGLQEGESHVTRRMGLVLALCAPVSSDRLPPPLWKEPAAALYPLFGK